jgi:hypothetical protein
VFVIAPALGNVVVRLAAHIVVVGRLEVVGSVFVVVAVREERKVVVGRIGRLVEAQSIAAVGLTGLSRVRGRLGFGEIWEWVTLA